LSHDPSDIKNPTLNPTLSAAENFGPVISAHKKSCKPLVCKDLRLLINLENTGFAFQPSTSCLRLPGRLRGSRDILSRALTGHRVGSNPAKMKKATLSDDLFHFGEYRIRTGDLLIANQSLYQLS
jgi:hypothetical protein